MQHAEINIFTPDGFERSMDGFGLIAPVVYIAVLVVAVIVSQVPQLPLALAAGAMWGTVPAGIYSIIGGFLGGMIAYFIGRSIGRSAVKAFTGKTIYFSTHRGEIYMGWLIFLTRLLPVFPYDLISYGAGISGLSLRVYALATLLGMIPSTFLLTYIGHAFTFSFAQTIGLALFITLLMIGLPWGIRRYNWFGMSHVIRME
ncbi:TVP38/TMEM64 family protein [filamentous cyanobacterium CCP2]|nr:TVP38/TMEM64 family protein [filamentous cyanobacterium CCP2]